MKKRLLQMGILSLLMTSELILAKPNNILAVDINFIKTNGTKLVDENGEEFQIKSMGFGNSVWSEYGYNSTDHNADSYKELADLGFNTVRLYINYNWYTSDVDKDGKPDIWKRLDREISWAKEAGIKIYVNLHIAPGGSSMGYHGYSLWGVETPLANAMTNRQSVNQMWKEVAERYKDEDTIIGYGLLNEPIPNYQEGKTAKEMIQCWTNTAKMFGTTIREIDKNHILFIEPSPSVKKDGSYASTVNDNESILSTSIQEIAYQVAKPLGNCILEYHSYNPWAFSSYGINSNFTPLTQELLDNRSKSINYIDYRIKKLGLPSLLGEFGTTWRTFNSLGFDEEGLTGKDFVEQTIDNCFAKGINFSYHSYRDGNFGLYYNKTPNVQGSKADQFNTELAEIFKSKLTQTPSPVEPSIDFNVTKEEYIADDKDMAYIPLEDVLCTPLEDVNLDNNVLPTTVIVSRNTKDSILCFSALALGFLFINRKKWLKYKKK